MTKDELRREMRRRQKAMTDAERAAASTAVVANVMALPAWKSARWVMLFVPMRSEPDIRPLIETLWREKRNVALPWFAESAVETGMAGATDAPQEPGEVAAIPSAPSVQPPLMQARWVKSWGEVHPGLSGFHQPNEALCPLLMSPRIIDMVLVPGQAFDSRGGRLGRGRGDYDRFLRSTIAGANYGVCFHTNYLHSGTGGAWVGDSAGDVPLSLPQEAHDVPMDWVITEQGAHDVRQSHAEPAV